MSSDALTSARVRNWQDATCVNCGYSLRGLVESRCPECGRLFDRADPATFNLGRHCGPLAIWLLKPTHWLGRFSGIIVASVVVAQMFLFLAIGQTLFLMALAWLAMAGPYLFWTLIRKFVRRWYSQPSEVLRRDREARHRIARNVVIASIVVCTQVPMLMPFWISRPSLDAYANHLYTEVPIVTPPAQMDRWCGLYYVSRCTLSGNSVEMFVGGRAMLYSAAETPEWGYRHFSGRWYLYDAWGASWYPVLY